MSTPLPGVRFLAAAFSLTAALSLSACSGAVPAAPTGGGNQAAAPAAAPAAGPGNPGGPGQPIRGGIVTRQGRDPIGWDPLATTAAWTNQNTNMVLEGLTSLVQGRDIPGDIRVAPLLAERWETPDPLTYVFHLQKGVKFKDNPYNKSAPVVKDREMTAEDVVWSFKRASDPLTGSRETKWKLGPVKDLLAVDKYTFKITLKEPYAPLLTYLSANPFWIIPKETIEKFGDMVKVEAVAGTGPWIVEEYKPNVIVRYRKNPDYWQKGLPYLDGTNDPITFQEGAVAAFRTGKLDWTTATETTIDSVRQSNPSAGVREALPATYYWIGMRVDQKPFNDVRVRHAIAMSIDYDGWIKTQFRGKGQRISAMPPGFSDYFLPYEEWGDAKKWYQYDPQKSRELLAEAGFPNGFKVQLNVGGADYYGAAAAQQWEVMKKWLGDIGIEAELKTKLYTSYASSTFLGDYDGMAGPQTTHAYFEPNDFSYYYFYPGMAGNVSHVDDPELNRLNVAQIKETDPKKRADLIKQIQKVNAEQSYILAMPQGNSYELYQPWLMGFGSKYGACAGNVGVQYLKAWVDPSKKPAAAAFRGAGS
ncbi:MAG: ABC transporter substrate-binding protein [Chloroflexi bacterium]|nr:ABC transporter substrate-binding protein [Chloroflexota bacterium]